MQEMGCEQLSHCKSTHPTCSTNKKTVFGSGSEGQRSLNHPCGRASAALPMASTITCTQSPSASIVIGCVIGILSREFGGLIEGCNVFEHGFNVLSACSLLPHTKDPTIGAITETMIILTNIGVELHGLTLDQFFL